MADKKKPPAVEGERLRELTNANFEDAAVVEVTYQTDQPPVGKSD